MLLRTISSLTSNAHASHKQITYTHTFINYDRQWKLHNSYLYLALWQWSVQGKRKRNASGNCEISTLKRRQAFSNYWIIYNGPQGSLFIVSKRLYMIATNKHGKKKSKISMVSLKNRIYCNHPISTWPTTICWNKCIETSLSTTIWSLYFVTTTKSDYYFLL